MEVLLLDLVQKFPILASIIAVVGILRLVVKPVVSILHAVAAETKSPKDNELLLKVEESSLYKGLLWVLDYLASIKIIK